MSVVVRTVTGWSVVATAVFSASHLGRVRSHHVQIGRDVSSTVATLKKPNSSLTLKSFDKSVWYQPLGLAGQLLAALMVPVGDGKGLTYTSVESGMLIRKGANEADVAPPPDLSRIRIGDTSLTLGGGSLFSSTSD